MSQPSKPVSGADGRKAKHRILLAEDDHEMRRVVADALRKAGHDVIEACDGAELIDRVARAISKGHLSDRAVDLIVTDVRMPGGNGLDVVETLRATEWGTPVIVMTAFGDSKTRAHAERLGAIMLDKPFRMVDLMKTVRLLLA